MKSPILGLASIIHDAGTSMCGVAMVSTMVSTIALLKRTRVLSNTHANVVPRNMASSVDAVAYRKVSNRAPYMFGLRKVAKFSRVNSPGRPGGEFLKLPYRSDTSGGPTRNRRIAVSPRVPNVWRLRNNFYSRRSSR